MCGCCWDGLGGCVVCCWGYWSCLVGIVGFLGWWWIWCCVLGVFWFFWGFFGCVLVGVGVVFWVLFWVGLWVDLDSVGGFVLGSCVSCLLVCCSFVLVICWFVLGCYSKGCWCVSLWWMLRFVWGCWIVLELLFGCFFLLFLWSVWLFVVWYGSCVVLGVCVWFVIGCFCLSWKVLLDKLVCLLLEYFLFVVLDLMYYWLVVVECLCL